MPRVEEAAERLYIGSGILLAGAGPCLFRYGGVARVPKRRTVGGAIDDDEVVPDFQWQRISISNTSH
jgi:hypothetical protein